MTIAEALPQYAWKYDIERGYFLDVTGPLGVTIRYRPVEMAGHDSTERVQTIHRDVETLIRRMTTVPYLRIPPLLDGGSTVRVW